MNICNIQQYLNDKQYTDNVKDGVSMNERSFIRFVKDIIEEYGEWKEYSLFIDLSYLPFRMKKELLKQWMFFEGYIEYYEEIFSNTYLIESEIEENKSELEFWIENYRKEIEQDSFDSFLSDNDLVTYRHSDNGENMIIRR